MKARAAAISRPLGFNAAPMKSTIGAIAPSRPIVPQPDRRLEYASARAKNSRTGNNDAARASHSAVRQPPDSAIATAGSPNASGK